MSLVELTFDGEVDKVKVAIERLRQFEPDDGYYLAFSGGKDSTVILDLCKQAGVKHEPHFHMCGGVDAPESIRFTRKHHPEVILDPYKRSMWQLCRDRGCLPTGMRRFCCQEYKEKWGFGRFIITGVRKEESVKRAGRSMVEQCMKARQATHFLHPIIDWTQEEVWEYIRGRELPYCSLYDEGRHRIGCVGCPMGNPKADMERWPKLMNHWRKVAIEVYEARKGSDRGSRYKGKLKDAFGSGEAYFNWWLNKGSMRVSLDQMEFEFEEPEDENDPNTIFD